MNARARLFALALTLPLFAACEQAGINDVEPESTEGLETVLPSALLESTAVTDGGGVPLFDQLAAEIPEFGGLFRHGRCTIGLVLTSGANQERAVQIVKAAIERIMGRACAEGGVQVRVQAGDFTYVQLIRFLHAARPLHEIRGVTGVAVDFSLNKLVVTVSSRSVAAAVLDALPGLEIPAAAVSFKLGQGGGSRG